MLLLDCDFIKWKSPFVISLLNLPGLVADDFYFPQKVNGGHDIDTHVESRTGKPAFTFSYGIMQ